jgi:hypothetical protein
MNISQGMSEVFAALARQAAHQVDTRPGVITPGKIAAVWAKYQHEIEALVQSQKLQPLQIIAERSAHATLENVLFWWNPAGGWPLAHFHVGDRIYPANENQWNSFCTQVLAKVGANLQKANVRVSFEEFSQITQGAQHQMT